MKKGTGLLLAAILTAGLLFGCTGAKTATPALGEYRMDHPDAIATYVRLEADDTFFFSYSVLSSYLPTGTYAVEGDVLTLSTDDAEAAYVFRIEGDTLIFDGTRSTGLPVFKGEGEIVDGAVFVYQVE